MRRPTLLMKNERNDDLHRRMSRTMPKGLTMATIAVRARPYLHAIGVFVLVRLTGLVLLAILAGNRHRELFDVLKSWDGDWYLAIAENGYDNVPPRFVDAGGQRTPTTPLAFFPLYPTLIRVVAPITGSDSATAALLVSLIAGCVAAAGILRVARVIDPRPKTGLLLIALWGGAPMAITLSMAYTEALFTALAAWALVGVLERNWLLAGVCTAFAGLVRPSASVLVGTVALAAIVAVFRAGKTWQAMVCAVLSPVGLFGWWGYVAKRTGSLTGWFDIQRQGWFSYFDGGQQTVRFFGDIIDTGNSVMETVTMLLVIAAVVLTILIISARIPWPLWLYGGGTVLMVLVTAGITYSKARFLIPAFPLLIPVARGLANRKRHTMIAATIAYVLFGSWFSAYSLTGWTLAI
ncbi:glycosyltransferase family 39 protein [Kibdelosporangium philippinense]|uniref:Glycosyltransferase family 39 protein n=1 Tax=Kibdelosporangium philippinense TaxID=211113 RepID=A0ABS8ZL59_9PSEU|nr:glycosyltransferase family 39 protein [Kibdelosporangium philippinense]MCE7006537.1 glycosyltransferase family 39 protein [Kibdelosporangium philippinense]